MGHKGWVYCLRGYKTYLISGGDDSTIKVWDIKSGKMLEELNGHTNGVTCFTIANTKEMFSGSYDHYILCWDLEKLNKRIYERNIMFREDILSRKYEVYYKALYGKKKKGAKKAAKKKM
jgi:WD40 repeat protein